MTLQKSYLPLARLFLLTLCLLPMATWAAGTVPTIVFKDTEGMEPASGSPFSKGDSNDEYKFTINQWPSSGEFYLRIGMGNQQTQLGMQPDNDGDALPFGEENAYNTTKIGNDLYWKVTASHDVYATITVHVIGADNADISQRKVWLTGEKQTVPVPMNFICNTLITSYSSSVPMDLPDGLRAYEAYSYDNKETTADKHGTLHMRRLDYIPANTGVVLVGKYKEEVTESGETQSLKPGQSYSDLYMLTPRTENIYDDLTQVWTNRTSYSDDAWHNFLVPEVTGNSKIGNATTDNNDIIIYRHFGLAPYHTSQAGKDAGVTLESENNYWGFFRFTSQGRVGANKAWLRLPTAEQALKDCNNDQTLCDKYGHLNYSGQILADDLPWIDASDANSSKAKVAMVFDDSFGSVTGISSKKTAKSTDDNWYTLQGMKLASQPKLPGLYIHNGKTIIIK